MTVKVKNRIIFKSTSSLGRGTARIHMKTCRSNEYDYGRFVPCWLEITWILKRFAVRETNVLQGTLAKELFCLNQSLFKHENLIIKMVFLGVV